MEAAGTLRRQHRPCRGLRSFQMTRWQRPNEQQRGCNAASLSLAENRVGALPATGAVKADFVLDPDRFRTKLPVEAVARSPQSGWS